jgi:hypothetical protein
MLLTLGTDDGFSTSFGLKADDLSSLEATARSAHTRPRPAVTKN